VLKPLVILGLRGERRKNPKISHKGRIGSFEASKMDLILFVNYSNLKNQPPISKRSRRMVFIIFLVNLI